MVFYSRSNLVFYRLCKELELKQHALGLLAEREGNSQASQLRLAADAAQAALEAAQADAAAAEARLAEMKEAAEVWRLASERSHAISDCFCHMSKARDVTAFKSGI